MTATGYRYDATAFRAVFESNFTYLAGVRRNAHRYAARTALHDPADGRRWSYAELWADAGRVAAGLAERGVQPGDVVVFSLFNSPEFVLAWLGAQRLGAIASPINFRLSAGEVAHVLDDSRPAAFLYDATLAATAEQALTHRRAPPGAVPDHRRPARTAPSRSRRCWPPMAPPRPIPAPASTTRRPGCTPRARPGCPRASRSTAWSRCSPPTT